MKMQIIPPADMMPVFNTLSDSLQRQVHRKMLRAAATAIKKQYRNRSPQGSKTGSTDLMSDDLKAKRGGVKNRLRKSLADKPSSKWSTKRELARAGIIATKVGHRYTKGDPKSARYAHLVNDGHVAVYWGHRGGGRVKAIKYQNEAQRASIAPVKAAAVAKGRDAVIAAAKKARQKMLQVGK
jgi:hypothetical protein